MPTSVIPWHTRARISGVVLAGGAELGIEEKWDKLQKHETKPGWWGKPRIMGPRDRRLRIVTLSCKDRQPPGWDHLRVRDQVLYQSTKHIGVTIPAGMTTAVLRYSPCPEAKKPSGFAVYAIRADTNARVAVGVVGKTVTIEPIPGVDVVVRYRPIFPCKVSDIDEGDASEVEGRQSWGLTLAVTA